MKQLLLPVVLALAALAVPAVAQDKGTTITLDGYSSTTPATWVKESPSNRMRFYQFKIPKAKNDTDDGELVIFKGITGSSKDNVQRWKSQFKAPKDKTIDDVSKVEEIKIGGIDATQLDIKGTYMFNPAPFNPKSKTEPRADYRMIAIQWDAPDNIYHIKITGPAKTVEENKKGFDAWIKGFKK